MTYLTTRINLKLQLSPGLVTSYDIQPGNVVGLFWDTKHTHTHTYLLTYLLTFPGPTQGPSFKVHQLSRTDILLILIYLQHLLQSANNSTSLQCFSSFPVTITLHQPLSHTFVLSSPLKFNFKQ